MNKRPTCRAKRHRRPTPGRSKAKTCRRRAAILSTSWVEGNCRALREENMAGGFGPKIDSRADCLNCLAEARKLASSMVASRPNDNTLNVVRNQLDAVAQWSAGGRTPTPEERNRIDMGYRMYREYDDDPDPEVQRLEELA